MIDMCVDFINSIIDHYRLVYDWDLYYEIEPIYSEDIIKIKIQRRIIKGYSYKYITHSFVATVEGLYNIQMNVFVGNILNRYFKEID